jgi:hypothetical protein
MDLSDTLEKLHDALRVMVSSEGDIRTRLEATYATFHTLQLSPIPRADFANRIHEIVDTMTGGNGAVKKTLIAMTDNDTGELATKIFDLFNDIQRAHDREDRP